MGYNLGCKLSLVFSFFLIASLVFSGYQIPLVKADLSFGKTDIGAVHGHPGDDALHGSKFTLTEDGTITAISWYGDDNNAGGNATCGIYDDSGTGGDAGNLVASSSEISVSNSLEWQEHTVSNVFLSAGDYWIYLFHEESISFTRENTGTGGVRSLVYDGLPDPFGTQTDEVREWSIYANYTTAEGQDLSFSLFENFNIWDSSSKTIETSNTFSQNFNTWESQAFNKEVGFKLYEPFNLWSYLTTNKEQSFTFFENFNLWESLTMASEGVALDLYFTFFEGFNAWASIGAVVAEEITLEDVYGLAALGFIMAIVAICLAVAFKKK